MIGRCTRIRFLLPLALTLACTSAKPPEAPAVSPPEEGTCLELAAAALRSTASNLDGYDTAAREQRLSELARELRENPALEACLRKLIRDAPH